MVGNVDSTIAQAHAVKFLTANRVLASVLPASISLMLFHKFARQQKLQNGYWALQAALFSWIT